MTFYSDRSTTPPEHPRLRTDVRVDVVSDHEALVMSGLERYIFDNPTIVAILPMLDGRHTVADIVEKMDGRAGLRDVMRAVAALGSNSMLVDGPPSDDPLETAWFDHLQVGAMRGAAWRDLTSVSVRAVGDVDTARLEAELSELGLSIVDVADADIDVVLCDDYLNSDLEAINAAALGSDRPWIIASPVRASLWLGPLFVPGVTGCWKCLEQRLAGNRQMERYIQRIKGVEWAHSSVPAGTRTTERAAAAIVATEVDRVASGGLSLPGLLGRLMTIDLLTWQADPHILVRQPQCSACGDPEAHRSDRPVVLTPQPKIDGVDSGHRVITPAATVARLEHHVSPLTGAVTNLHRFEAGDDEVSHNWAAGHNFAMMSNSTYLLRKNIRGLSGGKGRSDIQAKASAICEAIERYSGVWRGDEAVRRGTAAQLGSDALDLDTILGFSEAQYANRAQWNPLQTSGIHLVPEPLDPDREIDWTQVWSLTNDEPKWVPTAYCYFGHPDAMHKPFCYSDANGNAAGNTLEEAILQGLLELVERDSIALWWYNRIQMPEVDLDSIEDPYTDQLLAFYGAMDRDLRLLDVTSDLGIPSFVAVSRRLGHPVEDPLIGFGAHVEPRLGALRALTECNQFLPSIVERDAKGNTKYGFDDGDMLDWFTTATFETEPYLVPDGRRPVSDVRTMNNLTSLDITEEINSCVEILREKGLEVFVLDQSRPDLDIKVAKVIVPGLRHFWRRLGEGRLYEVPVESGLLDAPHPESDLNPKSIFF